MKKSIGIAMMLVMLATVLVFSSIVSAAAPADFKTMDSFDGYANTQAMLDAGFTTYAYGNTATTFELVTTGARAGKALKLTNGAASERIDFVKAYTMVAGADGISFWINNTSSETVAIGPLVSYNGMVVGAKYYARANSSSTFVETDPAGNQWYPIWVAAGEKVEIAIPFDRFVTTYAWTDPTLIFSVWGVATEYAVVVDDIRLYGVDNPDPVPTENPNPQTGDEFAILPVVLLLGAVLVLFATRKRSLLNR